MMGGGGVPNLLQYYIGGLLYIELWAVMLLFKIHQNILMLNAYVQYSKYIASNY